MKRALLPAFFLLTALADSFGQNTFRALVLDSLSREPLTGATVVLKNATNGATADAQGSVVLQNIPAGEQTVVVSFVGYRTLELTFRFPLEQTGPEKILLAPSEAELEEVVIEATRANRSVADLPTRTEVLTEEIDEAASMEPGRIAHLLTHSTGIQVQTTSASSNGAVVRIQGLNGRYTQILQDGFPLYGGFSGSLDVLQIPPLDLRQVEYVKGSASTLYGGGAIAGLINLLTKKPGTDETLLHVNVSHIGSKDFNAFMSRKSEKFGFTNLASLHLHAPYDADGDGYSDVPEVSKFNFNPKIYYYPGAGTEICLGANIAREQRMGGDMNLIGNSPPGLLHYYFDRQESSRYTTRFSARKALAGDATITLRNSFSVFDRFIEIRENAAGRRSAFGGKQSSSFTELNYHLEKTDHNLSAGLNTYTDRFSEPPPDAGQSRSQEFITFGAYLNHLWEISRKVAVESGLRTDYALAESAAGGNEGETFVLPRLSALYKLSENLGVRLGGGMGYRMPTVFSEEAEPFGYNGVQPVDFATLKAERSYGGSIDFKYRSGFGSPDVLFTFNQLFFYNIITRPILLTADTPGVLFYSEVADRLNSRGFESQIKLTIKKVTWFLGYTYTDAFLQDANAETPLTLTPKHSIKGDLLYSLEGKWRIGWDYEYKSEQLLSSGRRSRWLFTTGIVVERTIDSFVIFLNAENFTDVRQTRYESLASGPYDTPQFTEVWAPLDGFFFNAGLKLKW